MAKEDCHGRVQKHSCYCQLNRGHLSAHNTNPIGVFDSGVGGLSVLRALQQEMPLERFVYVADNGHAPYGERDDRHVLSRSHAIADHLIAEHRIKALVIACNTATAAAIHTLRNAYPALPIVGIEPALKPAAMASKTGVIGVIATRGTLKSEKFRKLLDTLQGVCSCVLQPCDGLADAIEHADSEKTLALCENYLRAMGEFGRLPGQMDFLVLGCTHYAFAAAELQMLVGPQVELLEAGAPVARQTRRLLAQHGLGAIDTASSISTSTDTQTRYYSTGDLALLDEAIQRWMHVRANSAAIAGNPTPTF